MIAEARLILGLCDRFHCLPSQVMNEDISIIKYVKVESMLKENDG